MQQEGCERKTGMNHTEFTQTLSEAVQLSAEERYTRFARVHDAIWKEYQSAVESISREKAAETGSDGRSIAQVVGHIAEWDRFFIQMCAEFMIGLPRPRSWSLKGYLGTDGSVMDFDNIEAFNQYQVKRQAELPWEDIQRIALRAGDVLYRLFSTPGLMDAPQLEQSKPGRWQLPGFSGEAPMAWMVWAIIMEHEGIEHALDLGISF
jgi:hypothetical protein